MRKTMNKCEINKDFYCWVWADIKECSRHMACIDNEAKCLGRHRKFPTLKQFKKEYSFEWTGPVFFQAGYENDCIMDEWWAGSIQDADKYQAENGYEWLEILCACSPFCKKLNNNYVDRKSEW